MSHHMSMEAVLDQEAKEVLALLEGDTAHRARNSTGATAAGRAPSPFTPRSPVRSMLDIGDSPPRAAPSAASNNGFARGGQPIRSMLDISGPPSSASSTRSAQTSPTEANYKAVVANQTHPRSVSDAAARPADFGPRAPGFEKPSAYQFSGYLPSNPGGPVVPKRNTQGSSLTGKKIANAMSDVMKGDLSAFGGRDRGRNHSLPDTGISSTAKSRSPHSRLGLRSNSPHTGSGSDTSKFTLRDGRVLDMNSAYRRLSDGNLALSGGSLSTLSKTGRRGRQKSGDSIREDDARLEKDYVPVEGEEGVVVDSSEEEEHTSDEDGVRRKKGGKDTEGKSLEPKTFGMGRATGERTARSLLAAAEEERVTVAAKETQKYKVRSLLEPETSVTGPSGSKAKSSKSGVHPHTSFDDIAFTPITSDTEADLKDVQGAQALAMNMTVITSTLAAKRCVRSIYRGNFNKMIQEAEDHSRRVRKYIVATDLSEEAQHALEWTIGTVLRDGDSMLAIYCVDEEVGITTPEISGDDKFREQAAAVAASAVAKIPTPKLAPVPEPSPLSSNFKLEPNSGTPSPLGREKGKEEQTRVKAVQLITEMVTKLLRKTKLQVKVVVEVLHCKSPKHLITEVIDRLSPTLVILGSRGRSNLKGVILGSFSNYLVTKSSVPVMVARKKLSKNSSRKYRRPNVRQPNNLDNPSSTRTLAEAVIEKPRAEKKSGL